jgi:hypothetical protein
MRRAPLVAGGFLAGALIGALPPVQVLPSRWNCIASGGYWVVAAQACEYRAAHPFGVPPRPGSGEHDLLNEESR